MKSHKAFFVFVGIVIVSMIYFFIKEQSIKSNSFKKDFSPSSKELNEKGKYIEHLDSTTLLYSNFKYKFSMNFPDNWQLDRGVSEHTIIRGSQKDSAISFSVNVITINDSKLNDLNIWDLWDKKELKMDENSRQMLSNSLNTELYNYITRKIYISNKEAIETKCSYIVRELEFEYEIQCFFYSIYQPPYTYTIGLQIPWDFYIENPSKYDYFITNFVLMTNE